jgi:AsmA protein
VYVPLGQRCAAGSQTARTSRAEYPVVSLKREFGNKAGHLPHMPVKVIFRIGFIFLVPVFMRKRLFIGFLTLFAALFILLFIPSLFKKQVSDILKSEINDHIDADVTFTDADINLWRSFPQFTLTLEDFIVSGKKEFKGDTLVKMKELHIVLSSFRFLFFDEIEITDLTLSQPDIHLLVHRNGLANFNIFSNAGDTTSAEETDVKLEFESLAIENGNFFYDDKALDVQLLGNGLSLNGSGNVKQNLLELSVNADTKSFSTFYGTGNFVSKKNIALTMNLSYDLSTGLLTFLENHIQVNHLELDVSGSYRHAVNNHYFDLKFHSADSEFKDLLSVSNTLFADFKKLKVKGHFHLDGFVKGIYDGARDISPAFRVNMKVTDGFVKYEALPSSLSDIDLDLVAENNDSIFQNTLIDLKNFKMNIGKNPFRGFITIRGLTNSYIRSDIIASINLQDLETIYPLDSISMGGQLDFDLKANGRYSGSLERLGIPGNASISETAVPSFTLSVNLADGIFKYDHLPQAISGINFSMKAENRRGTLDHTSVRIDRLEAKLGDHPLNGFVHVNGFKNPYIDSELKANLNLSDLERFFPLEGVTLKGLFDLDMKVSGQLSDSLKRFPMIDAKLNLADGYIESESYPAPIEKTHLLVEAVNQTGKLKDTRLNIDTLTYSIEDETFFVKGEISDLEKFNYDLAVKGVIYLDKLKKILKLDDMLMAGEVDVDLKTSGNYPDLLAKRYHKLPTEGQVLMKNVVFQNEAVPHGLKITQGHFYFSNEKIFLDTLHGSIGESGFNLTGHLYNYIACLLHSEEKIRGDLLFESEYFNLNELMRSEKVTSNDTSHHHLEAVFLPKNIDFTFDTRITNLLYKNLSVDDLRGEIQMKDGILMIKETEFETLDANFNLTGTYDTRDGGHPAFDVSLKITDLDISKAHDALITVQAVAPAAEHTYGLFSMDYKLKGELLPNMYPLFESVTGGGTIRIREGRINGMKLFHHISGITKKDELLNPDLKDIVMETTVESGIFYVKPFSMKLGGFETDIEGKHELSGSMSYVLRIALPPFDLVKIPVHISGTYDNPKIHLGKRHEETAKTISLVSIPPALSPTR